MPDDYDHFERLDTLANGWSVTTLGHWCDVDGQRMLVGWSRIFDDLGVQRFAAATRHTARADLWAQHDGLIAAVEEGALAELQEAARSCTQG